MKQFYNLGNVKAYIEQMSNGHYKTVIKKNVELEEVWLTKEGALEYILAFAQMDEEDWKGEEK